jgi:methionine aminotransferase
MTPKIPSKLPNLGTTIFTKMGKMANDHNAINLSQGFPGFPPDDKLLQEVEKAIHDGRNQYAPLGGHPALCKTVSQKIEDLYGYSYDPKTELTMTAGATQAIFTAISATINPGDEVIVFKPAYDCYEPAIELYGGKPVLVEMQAPDYELNWQEVREKITDKTKMIVINSPHNPTGKIISEDDIQQLREIVKGTDIFILSDEVYEHQTFDGQKHLSVARYPDLAERAFITCSFGKTFHVTGWKLGYCAAPKAMMDEFRKIHQYNVFCVNHPMQVALNEYMQNPEHYKNLPNFYQEKRDFFTDTIKGSRFEFTPSDGTYFQIASFKNITDEKDTDFAIRLIKKKKLAAIPVSVFCKDQKDEKMLRFCFAKEKETLKKAAEVINSI